ncbi:ThuA-like domain-containing protein [Dactylonectria estremocensis]|uniref:ThuA-like domain-containing protein n=1 Tax=Dactylonectria estremocensis TaxID=1079267 RepID=A0A9P9EMB6_9HYPO|nr:ThuA-like domain-containing protein [Dactylonectria estremocensis]
MAEAAPKPPRQPAFRVLVFSKTAIYVHKCIPAGIAALRALADRTRLFTLDATEDAETFTPDILAGYATVIFLHTIGPILNTPQLAALQSYIRGGGGFIGIHGAAGGNLDSEWYGRLVGAQFADHPAPEEGTLVIEDAGHEIMSRSAGGERRWMDEWYNFKTHPRENDSLHVLVRGDTSSFKGGKMGVDHPLVWCQEFDGGRSFFTALGHFDEAYRDEWFMGQLQQAILWTTGGSGEAKVN